MTAPEVPEVPAGAGLRLWLGSAAVALVVALAGYGWTGRPQALLGGADAVADAAAAQAAQGEGPDPQQMVQRLEARLQNEPSAQGFAMLGRSYAVLGRQADAVAAYRKAVELEPANADLLADLADTLGVHNGHKLEGEPSALVQRALQASPQHLKALSLSAVAAFQRRDFGTALSTWERIVAIGPAEHPLVQAAAQTLLRVREMAASAAAAKAAR